MMRRSPRCARLSASRRMSAKSASSSSGARAAGRISAARWAPTTSSATSMAGGNFFSELKRRNVYRVGAAYAVAAFVLLEVVSNAAPFLDLPLWIGRGLILLLIIGFPAVLGFAWVYE